MILQMENDNHRIFSALTVSPLLTEAAQMKANDMATNGYFAHTSPTGKHLGIGSSKSDTITNMPEKISRLISVIPKMLLMLGWLVLNIEPTLKKDNIQK